MGLLNIAYVPAVEVSPQYSVRETISALLPTHCDAVAVKEEGRLVGILTTFDIMRKVVLEQLDPQATLVGDVMTCTVVTVHPETPPEEALDLMLKNNIRHIPISMDGETVDGMLSLRKVLLYLVEDQRDNLAHLEAFLNVDGPGG